MKEGSVSDSHMPPAGSAARARCTRPANSASSPPGLSKSAILRLPPPASRDGGLDTPVARRWGQRRSVRRPESGLGIERHDHLASLSRLGNSIFARSGRLQGPAAATPERQTGNRGGRADGRELLDELLAVNTRDSEITSFGAQQILSLIFNPALIALPLRCQFFRDFSTRRGPSNA